MAGHASGCARWRPRRRSRLRAPRGCVLWSPDGRSLGFFAGGTLKRLDLGGGAHLTLIQAFAGRGGAWTTDNGILVAPGTSGPLMRVSASGGGDSGSDHARPAAVQPPLAVPAAGWATIPVLCLRCASHGRDLPRRTRRKRPDAVDAGRRRWRVPVRGPGFGGSISSRRARARRSVRRRRVAALGARRHPRGAAAGRGPAGADG
jgi:hypothetical protein